MDQNEQDILKSLFCQMPEETLPPAFQAEMMQRIRKEAIRIAKRNQWLRFLALIAATMFTIGLAVAALIYLGIPQITAGFPRITIPPHYIYFGALVLILLFADHLFRQHYDKKTVRP